jgi:hypothetical protein
MQQVVLTAKSLTMTTIYKVQRNISDNKYDIPLKAKQGMQGINMDIKKTEVPSQNAAQRQVSRSYFTKKLERKFQEKDMDVPQYLINLMDVPFEQFTKEDKEHYETHLKPLAYVFAEQLAEVYETMGRPRDGWEEMLERVDPTPMKVWATLVLYQQEEAQQLGDDLDIIVEEPLQTSAPTEKIKVRPYLNKKDQQKERWWEKKVF